MLVKLDYLNHKANNLLVFFENYLNSIEKLPKGTAFNTSFCPNKDLSKYINKKKKDGSDCELKKKFIAFHVSFLTLKSADRKKFLKIFESTNKFPWILENPTKAIRKSNYPGNTGNTCHALLTYLFANTMGNEAYDLKNHYQKFYDSQTHRWCPFCGMETYKVPERQKEDYDHLLCKKEYPAAAVNMMNLFPMGEGCNRRYKKDDDVLNCLGKATKVVHPYSESISPRITFKGSKLHTDESKCSWVVKINPKTDKVKAWNKIFKINERCQEEYLVKRPNSKQDPEYKRILYLIVRQCQMDQTKNKTEWTWSDLKTRLENWVDTLEPIFNEDSNLVKIAFYKFLINDADKTYQLALVDMINQK